MKRKRSHDKKTGQQSSYPSYSYSSPAYMGDPRLSAMAQPKESPQAKKKSKVTSRLVSVVCLVLSVSLLIGIFVLLMRQESDPPPPPSNEQIEPPDNTPTPNPPQGSDSTDVSPPSEGWVMGRLTFNIGSFVDEYQKKHGEDPQFNYHTTHTQDLADDIVLDRCAILLLKHYYHNGQAVEFANALRYRRIVKIYLIDAAMGLRLSMPHDQEADVWNTLSAISHAAERLSALLCDNGKGEGMMPDYVLDEIADKFSMYDADLQEAFCQSQGIVWTPYSNPATIESALDQVCWSTARSFVHLFHSYLLNSSLEAARKNTPQAEYDQQMLQLAEQMLARLRELLETVLIRTETSYIGDDPNRPITAAGFSLIKYYQAVMEQFPSLVEEFSEWSYLDFIRQAASGKFEWNNRYIIYGRADAYAEYCIVAPKNRVDLDRLSQLVGQLNFEISDVRITPTADLVFYDGTTFRLPTEAFSSWKYFETPRDILTISLLTAGVDESGCYYLKSANYAAVLTASQYREFVEIFSTSIRS